MIATIARPILAALLLGPGPTGGPTFETATLSGKVVAVAEAIKARGIEADKGPIEGQVALLSADGAVIPLISDEASRAFFLDDRMRNRKAEVVGRRYAGLPYLQVLTFRVEEGGRLRTPEYYCEICAISVRYPQTCPCCQGDMVLQFRRDEGP